MLNLLFSLLMLCLPCTLWARSEFIVTYSDQHFFKAAHLREHRVLVKADDKLEAARKLQDQGLEVIDVTANMRLFPMSTDDPFTYSQWPLFEKAGGIELLDAWDKTTGSGDTVIAVIDSGILPHEDLQGRLLRGADMISDAETARDGDGRDLNPYDEGDYVLADELCPNDPNTSNSSWHGTHVTGTIAANTNNQRGIAGIDLKAKILPIRALGKCGGSLLDVADGIRWAVGGQVDGLPVNENPAHVINLSLGGFGTCSRTMQAAIDFANERGAVVVVAAGNDEINMDWLPIIPATCHKVITVGAVNRSGTYAWYSNRGEAVDVAGPGGDGARGYVVSLSNAGTREPAQDAYRGSMGTSMAAPHVAGVAALVRAANPGLYPAQVEDIIKRGHKALSCPRGQCGAGLVDANEAVIMAEATVPDPNFRAFEPITSGYYDQDPTAGLRPIERQEEVDSGACGSVAVSGGPGGPGRFLFTLCFILGLLMTNLIKKVRYVFR